jgi:DNA replication protein DnaC
VDQRSRVDHPRRRLRDRQDTLATALAVCACQQGRRVRFTTLAGLANELQEAESKRELAKVVARYTRTELVILDELGYLALPDGAAELVFQVLSERATSAPA